jgi:hypothetical protein
MPRFVGQLRRALPLGRVLMELMIGPCGVYVTRDDLAAVWARDFRVLLEDHLPEFIERQPGRRPWFWWEFVAQQERPTDDGELLALLEAGEVSDDEIGAIFASADRFDRECNAVAEDGRPAYGAAPEDRAVHGVDPRLRRARVVRAYLEERA